MIPLLQKLTPGLRILLITSLVALQMVCRPRPDERRTPPGNLPLRYSIGNVDPRFGIQRERFLTLVREAESAWEQPQSLALFEYDPTSDFSVSLVFDERQQQTIEARQAKTELEAREGTIQSKMREYNLMSGEHVRLKARYETEAAAFGRRLDRHNATVADWNRKGGAPPEAFAALKEEEKQINTARLELEKTTAELNNTVATLNRLAEAVNELADRYNVDVNLFNGRFVESREFEQGQYDSKGIAVYQFNEESDLRVALMHEFGHALGFGHVDDPGAIMNRKLEQQDLANPRLTEEDLELLRNKFGR